MSAAQLDLQQLEICTMQVYNMLKCNWGKLHAFLGIIKLLTSLEGAEKHLKNVLC